MGFRWAQFGLLVLTITFSGGCAKPNPFAKETIARVKQTETEFLGQALMLIDRELNLAQNVLEGNANSDTRELAQDVFENQASLRNQLSRISANRGIELKNSVPYLNVQSSAKAQEKFLTALIDDRELLIQAFEYQLRDGESSDLRNLAGNTLPSLKKNLREAQLLWNARQSASIATEAAGASSRNN